MNAQKSIGKFLLQANERVLNQVLFIDCPNRYIFIVSHEIDNILHRYKRDLPAHVHTDMST